MVASAAARSNALAAHRRAHRRELGVTTGEVRPPLPEDSISSNVIVYRRVCTAGSKSWRDWRSGLATGYGIMPSRAYIVVIVVVSSPAPRDP